MKKILGLDLGTNSIGWSVIKNDFNNKKGEIINAGSRIIPMDKTMMDAFGSGGTINTGTAERTAYRGTRRLYQRDNLRRERLHRILNVLNFLPEHYRNEIDFENKLGQFKSEVKINYRKNNEGEYEFIFMDSFEKMVSEFKTTQPELFYKKKNGEETKIPLDWTIYYLRQKALKEKITKEELAWILLNFNQKRGYYQLRGDELSKEDEKDEKYYAFTVKEIKETEDKNAKGIWYEVRFEEKDWIYKRQSKESLNNWIGTKKEFIVTKSITKAGDTKRTFKAVDSEKDWIAIKEKAQKDISAFNKQNNTVGVALYIYNTLLENPTQKIRGKLIKTIERKYYKDELKAILKTQIEFHNELNIDTDLGKELYSKSINELYTYNEAHKNNILNKGFKYLFIDDIIFYQRPLKSQKSNISGCQYEYRVYNKEIKDTITDEIKKVEIKQPVQAISKSNPLFQEFRLWQFIQNLTIYQKEKDVDGKLKLDVDITNKLFANDEDWVKIFDFLNNKKEIKQSQLIDFLVKEKYIEKSNKDNYRWNYVEDKTYPMSDTRAQFLSRLKKVATNDSFALSEAVIIQLWHIIYSVSDKEQYLKALETFAKKNNLDAESFVASFEKFPPFKSDYAAYSEKAIKKMLPLMRMGKYWDENTVSQEVKSRINDIMERVNALNLPKNPTRKQINEAFEKQPVADDDIQRPLVKSFIKFKDKNAFTGLNTYQAGYAVYGRHSEASDIKKWQKPENIDEYLKNFKQHSLRNPIVEQVVTETLRTVRDIWKEYGDFNEIHIELGREMKNPAGKREQISKQNTENENTNHRIKQVLKELMNDGVSDVRDFSPSHQEILKIYEEGVFQNPNSKFDKLSEDDVEKVRKNPKPSRNDIIRYKLWLEQGYASPYTGAVISLSNLFSTDYQIEHIIPQSRYFDNSLSNKIICESEVNELKSNKTAYEFISSHKGQIIQLTNGKQVKVFDIDKYETHCKRYFSKNRTKLQKLLSEEIPDGFIERQMNDSRYISKLIKGLLSNIVRDEDEQSETSKHLIPITGAITSKLKQDWGLNNKWNEIVLPRFERLNKLTETNDFTYVNTEGKIIPTVPDDLQKGFNKKRIDHRHHALDAIVIACATRKHIQYLNSLNNEKEKSELQLSLLIKNKEGDYTKHFQLPWSNFPVDTKNSLDNIIVSFKQNLRVINKATNKYFSYKDENGNLRRDKNGNPKKDLIKQKGVNWAIRKPMHKEMVYGKVNFNAKKGKIATAIRTSLSDIKTRKHLDKITDKGIVRILENHLKKYINDKGNEDFENAFSPEGVENLNKNIIELNNGKKHQPIYKVRLYEVGSKFALSENKNSAKSTKYVEAADGTNLYFAKYSNSDTQEKKFVTIPFLTIVERQKQGLFSVPDKYIDEEKDIIYNELMEYLSPKDHVYVPTDEERENKNLIDLSNLSIKQQTRIFVVNDFSGGTCYFTPHSLAKNIRPKEVDLKRNVKKNKLAGSFDTKTASFEGNSIKDRCIKLKVNRLGQIVKVGEY